MLRLVVVALLASVKQSRRRPLCWANRLSRLVASLMAVTKEQATFPPIHQTATLDVAPLAACTVQFTHSFRNIRDQIRSSVGLLLSPRATALRLAYGGKERRYFRL